eukprot:gene2200-4279_t
MGDLVKVCLASNPVVQASVFIPDGTKWLTLKGLIADRLGLPNFRIHHLKLISTSAKSGEITDPQDLRKFLNENVDKGVICMVHEDPTTGESTPERERESSYNKEPEAQQSRISNPFRQSLADLMADIDANSNTINDITMPSETGHARSPRGISLYMSFQVRSTSPPYIFAEVTVQSGCDWDSLILALAEKLQINDAGLIQRLVLVDNRNEIKSPSLNNGPKFWEFFPDYSPDDVFEVYTLPPDTLMKTKSIEVPNSTERTVSTPEQGVDMSNDNMKSSTSTSSPYSKENKQQQQSSSSASASGRLGIMDDLVSQFHVRVASDPSRQAEVSVVTDCGWNELTQGIATAFLGSIKAATIQTLVLVDSDGDEMSGLIATAEKFWHIFTKNSSPSTSSSSYSTNSSKKVLFHVHLEPVSKNGAKAVALEKAREAARAKVKKRLEEDIRGKQVVTEIHRKIDEIHFDVEKMRSTSEKNLDKDRNRDRASSVDKTTMSYNIPMMEVLDASSPLVSTAKSLLKQTSSSAVASVHAISESDVMSDNNNYDKISDVASIYSSTTDADMAEGGGGGGGSSLNGYTDHRIPNTTGGDHNHHSSTRNKFRTTTTSKRPRAAAVAETKLKEAMAKAQAKRSSGNGNGDGNNNDNENNNKDDGEFSNEYNTNENDNENNLRIGRDMTISSSKTVPSTSTASNTSAAGSSSSIVTMAKFKLASSSSTSTSTTSGIVDIPINNCKDWDELRETVASAFELDRERIGHFFLIDEDGDEMSPILNNMDRFLKFLRHYNELDGMSFAVFIDQNQIESSTTTTSNNNNDNDIDVKTLIDNTNTNITTEIDESTTIISSEPVLSLNDVSFRKACCEGDLISARTLLSSGVDVYAKDSEGHQVLHLACIAGHIEIVQWLVGMGVSLTNADNNGMTPLHHACDGMHVGVSLFLVKSGANMLSEDSSGLTPLHCISLQGLLQMVHLLRPHVSTLRSSSGLSLLHCACNGGHEEMVSFLLKNKAKIIIRDNEGMTPLHHACLNGHIGVAQMLVEHGAYHSSRDHEGMTPLLYACSEGHVSIIQWLATIGARLFIRNKFKDGALHLACQTGLIDLAKWLINNGVKITLKNKNGLTPYDIAKNEAHWDLCAYLEAVGVDQVEVDENDMDFEEDLLRQKELEEEQGCIKVLADNSNHIGHHMSSSDDADFRDDVSALSTGNETFSSTPGADSHFRECCAKGDVKTVMKMLALGVSPDACSANGSKPLHFACAGGHMDIVQELVRMGAGINVTNFKGSSPLHFSCYWQHEELSLWLINQGGDITVVNSDGFTPLHYVCMLGQVSLLGKILSSKGQIDISVGSDSAPSLLHCASDHGHDEIISILLESTGVDVNITDSQGRTAIHYASKSGELSTIQFLVRCNAKIDIKDKEGYTAILSACLSKSIESVQWLASQGASLYSANYSGDTCLHLASRVGNTELVMWLCECGVDPKLKNEEGLTAADLAKFNSHHDLSEWILTFIGAPLIDSDSKLISSDSPSSSSPPVSKTTDKNKIDTNNNNNNSSNNDNNYDNKDDKDATITSTRSSINEGFADDSALEERPEFALLKEYSMTGDVDAVINIVKQGDPNMENKNGSTVMHFASASGNLKLCRRLLECGVLPNKANNLGLTPFHCSCINGHLALVKWFYQQTTLNLSDMTADGRTALHHACYNGHVNIVEWLLKSGADMNVLNLDELTPFHDACYGGHIPVVAFLVNYGLSVMTTNYAGVTPLHVACDQGHLELVQWLIAEGAHIDTPDEYRRTPFLNACLYGHLRIAQWLVDQGVDIHAVGAISDRLNTALHLACQNGHVEVAKWLCERGLDMNTFNEHNETPLQFAMAGRHYDLSRWLIAKRYSYLDDAMDSNEYPEIAEALADNDNSKVIYLLEKVCTESLTVKYMKDAVPLHFLCAAGKLDLVQYYLRLNKFKVNAKTSTGITPLHCAAVKGHVNILIFLLQYGADVELRDVEGNTPFILALYMQRSEVCQMLFTEQTKVPLPDPDQVPPAAQQQLQLQSQHAITPSKFKLRERRNNPDEATVDCRVPAPSIFSCIPSNSNENNNDNSSQNARKHAFNDDSTTSSTNTRKSVLALLPTTPELFDFSGAPFSANMQDACLAGNFEEVKRMVEQEGENINARNPANASTALHFACVSGDLNVVKYLLDTGAQIDLRNVGGMTPAHIACDRKHSALVLYLLRHGADASSRNKAGDTPLHYVCSRGMTDVLSQLIQLPALVKNYDLEVRSYQGLTPLHSAVDNGHSDIVELLINTAVVQVNARDDENRTPLHYSALKGYLNIVELLWRRGGAVNATDDKGRTAFLYACICGHMSIAQWLVRHGSDPHAVTDNGNGALHAACRYGDLHMVKWLVEIGVEVHRQNLEKVTPIQYAAQGGFTDIVNWLDNDAAVSEVAGRRRNEINRDASE